MPHTFLTSESGAVTVDWVVLTAGLVGLGLATMTVVSSGVQDLSTDIDAELSRDDIIQTSFPQAPAAPSAYSTFDQSMYDAGYQYAAGTLPEYIGSVINPEIANIKNAISSENQDDAQLYLDVAYGLLDRMEDDGLDVTEERGELDGLWEDYENTFN